MAKEGRSTQAMAGDMPGGPAHPAGRQEMSVNQPPGTSVDGGVDGPAGPDLSLVMPARDEAAGLRQVLEEADRALGCLGISFEIILVDDGSVDGTSKRAREASLRYGVLKVLRHPRPLGYGAALRTGFVAAAGRIIAFTDADGQFDLLDLGRLLSKLQNADFVCGYRTDRQDALYRIILARCYNFLLRTFFGITVRDCDCALKAFRRDLLPILIPKTDCYLANAEMLLRAQLARLRIDEVGVSHRARRRGRSKVTLLDVPRTFLGLLPFWLRMRRLSSIRPVDSAQPAGDLLPLTSGSLARVARREHVVHRQLRERAA